MASRWSDGSSRCESATRRPGEEQEFFIDLLFYNYILRRFVVIDLKIEDFKPEFAGKMNFYLNAVDELERQPQDEPSIGLVLCPGRNKTVTEWALRGVDAPVAVARYTTGEMTLTDTRRLQSSARAPRSSGARQRALQHPRALRVTHHDTRRLPGSFA